MLQNQPKEFLVTLTVTNERIYRVTARTPEEAEDFARVYLGDEIEDAKDQGGFLRPAGALEGYSLQVEDEADIMVTEDDPLDLIEESFN